MPATRLAIALLLALACNKGDDGAATTDASATSTSTSTSTTDTTTDTTATSTSTSTTSTETTGAPIPPACKATSECPKGQFCLSKPCDQVMDEPGCDELRCYPQCSSPFDDSAFWTCADTQACCGMYPCMAGQCTERFDPTDG
ncbi:MAG: hypothetical protein IPK80_05175 [Nannocystis sp.]|nr:hypothetical protein [Nannocystis sp.]